MDNVNRYLWEQMMLDRPFPAAAEGLPKFSERALGHDPQGPTTQAMASILEEGLEAGQDALTILALCHASMSYDPIDASGEHPELADDIAQGTMIATRMAEQATQAIRQVLGHFDRGARVDVSGMGLRGYKVDPAKSDMVAELEVQRAMTGLSGLHDIAEDIGEPGAVRTCGVSTAEGADIEHAIVRLPGTDEQPYRFKVFACPAEAKAYAESLMRMEAAE